MLSTTTYFEATPEERKLIEEAVVAHDTDEAAWDVLTDKLDELGIRYGQRTRGAVGWYKRDVPALEVSNG